MPTHRERIIEKRIRIIETEYKRALDVLKEVQDLILAKHLQEEFWIKKEVKNASDQLKQLKREAISMAKQDNLNYLVDLQKARRAPAAKLIQLAYEHGKTIIAQGKYRAQIHLQAILGEKNYEGSEQWNKVVEDVNQARDRLKELGGATQKLINEDQPFNEKFEELYGFIDIQKQAAKDRLQSLEQSFQPLESKQKDSHMPHRQAPDKNPDNTAEHKNPPPVESHDALLEKAEKCLTKLGGLNAGSRLLNNTVDTVIYETERKLAVIKSAGVGEAHKNDLERMIIELEAYIVATNIKVIAQELAGYYADDPVKKKAYLGIVEEMREERRVIKVKAHLENGMAQIKDATRLMDSRFKVLENERDDIANEKYKLQALSNVLSQGYKNLANLFEDEVKKKYENRAQKIQDDWGPFLAKSLTRRAIEAHMGSLTQDLSSFNLRMRAVVELKDTEKSLCDRLTPQEAQTIQGEVKAFLNKDPSVAEMSTYKNTLVAKLEQARVVVPVDRTLTHSGANLFPGSAQSSPTRQEPEGEPAATIHVVPPGNNSPK